MSMQLLEFRDELMQGRFRLQLFTDDSEYTEKVVQEIFDEMKRLESLLSRFRPESDLAKINRLAQGDTTVISLETLHCLETAENVRTATFGLFDVAFRSERPDCPAFELLRRPPRIRSLCPKLCIDLGGIGKGFALDQAALLLEHYGLTNALLWADCSTVLALDYPEKNADWTVEVGEPSRKLPLRNQAVSCSGTAIRGVHLFNPLSGRFEAQRERCWVLSDKGAIADAFSTALLLATEEQLEMILETDHNIRLL